MMTDMRQSGDRPSVAEALRNKLRDRAGGDADYWSFVQSRRRGAGHGLFQYPAMMVPELQGALLDDVIAVDSVSSVYDPFMGSGTVLLEALRRGLDFYGVDINPLAVLLSQVKAYPPAASDADEAAAAVSAFVARGAEPKPHDFAFRSKWFSPDVGKQLERVREAITLQEGPSIRRFLWICMAETTRLVSNARTSTVKLHSYDEKTLRQRKPSVLRTFETVVKRNIQNLSELADVRPARQPLTSLRRGSILDEGTFPFEADVIMTSPPYGDNQTTVTYGQHSYLPLQWIDHRDLIGHFDTSLLSTTRRIDTLSLGGSQRLVVDARAGLVQSSPAMAAFLQKLEGGTQAEKRVVSFTHDYSRSLVAMSKNLRNGGFIFLTLGQRRVTGIEMPLVRVTRQLLECSGFQYVDTLERKLLLSRRRMGTHNRQGQLMAGESVLILQKR